MSKQTTIKLLDGEEAALQALAEKLNCRSRSGASSGRITWRELLHQIAAGHLIVSKPGVYSGGGAKQAQARPRKPFKAWVKYPPKWWAPNPLGAMKATDCEAASGRSAQELIRGGLVDMGNGFLMGLAEWMHLAPDSEGGKEGA